MATIYQRIETESITDENGNTKKHVKEMSNKIEKITEPDYIKIYTKMWCEFNNIPTKWQPLFLQLVTRMTYCNITNETGGQLVSTSKPYGDDIARSLGWKVESNKTNISLMKGLKALCECGAIRKINRGVYQINPEYAAKGEWKYNPRADRGGVEELIASFKMSKEEMKSEIKIIWADDGEESEINKMYREGMQVKPSENTILKQMQIKNNKY